MSQNPTGSAILQASSSISAVQPRVGFLGIGAQKCASTWLHDVLEGHPDVSMPADTKEVDYFSHKFDFGRQWYEQRFASDANLLCGEVSPSYLHTPGVIEKVAQYNPGMRIVLIVRDPIERAISNHKHEIRIGHIQGADLSFEFGLANNPSYVEQGLYAKHLENWLSRFPIEQFLILKFEDIVDEPEASFVRVCEFLGIDTDYRSPRLFAKSNRSYLNRSKGVENAKNRLRGVLRGVGLGGLWRKLGDTGLRAGYRKMNQLEADTRLAPPSPDTLRYLKSIYRPDLKDFDRLTGLSTTGWLQQ